jgi:hypothetical protein
MLLTGWKMIARHLSIGVRTAQRWQHSGLPVRRPWSGPRGPVLAYSDDIEDWIRTRGEHTGNGSFVRTLREARERHRQLSEEQAILRLEMQCRREELRQTVQHMHRILEDSRAYPRCA